MQASFPQRSKLAGKKVFVFNCCLDKIAPDILEQTRRRNGGRMAVGLIWLPWLMR